ncbi:ATP-binding protein [Modicisalibacter radicis]|uniref:ATP-binding protein n=1 Tax=Halomonas sp. EAR18 TaxID=2518972 RepID=UPI00109CB3AA|nr:ATP-binding protein [Halomonas sp. EAR18]
MSDKKLKLAFHGRIIDHLGIQMYQSPTAALAEMVSNAWDAGAARVDITLPDAAITQSARTISIKDDGQGMTFEECEQRFLKVGYDRRAYEAEDTSSSHGRPLMGRKGIGKFAGFGIAKKIEIATVSKKTGEKTVFMLDIDTIRSSSDYVDTSDQEIIVSQYLPPDSARIVDHGTVITLRELKLGRAISVPQFSRSMARRFNFLGVTDSFDVFVDGIHIPEDEDFSDVQFSFPKDYQSTERPSSILEVKDGWGLERLEDGNEIWWRFQFYNDTIKEEALQGISIFAHHKLAQSAFMFNLTGGLTTQTGPEYLAGSVTADFIDEQEDDLISTERQRMNWQDERLAALEEWGQKRVKSLLGIWKKRRGEEKLNILTGKLLDFENRLKRLGSEASTVEGALRKLASIDKLTQQQFQDLGSAILTAWEHGRLRGLIDEMSRSEDMDEKRLLAILVEANTIQALHTAESVKAKLEAINGLEARIRTKDLENAIRDYIAKNPWLISPEWETFAIERNVNHIIRDATDEAGLNTDPDFRGRVDLVLGSGRTLLVLEFMRPELKLDVDHINRFEQYVDAIRAQCESSTAIQFSHVIGYVVADKFKNLRGGTPRRIQRLAEDSKYAMTWEDLLSKAKRQWQEFFDHLLERNPDDERLQSLAGGDVADNPRLSAESDA